MNLKYILAAFLFFYALKGFAIADSSRTEQKRSLLLIPIVAYAPETRLRFGLSLYYRFYSDKNYSTTRHSSIFGVANYTQNKQSIFNLYSNYWSPKNDKHIVSDLQINNYPENFYGIGNQTKLKDIDQLQNKKFRMAFDAEKHLRKYLYSGISFLYQKDEYRDLGKKGAFFLDSTLQGKNGGQLFFSGLSLIYDSRNYINLSSTGALIKVFATANYKGFLSDYTLFRYEIQARKFFSFTSKQSIGIQFLHKGISGTQIPFYLYTMMGNESIMRGYYSGRFRDKLLMATQAEYRVQMGSRIILAAFMGLGNVAPDYQNILSNIKPNAGGGIRYIYDLQSRSTIRLDYGIGEKPAGEVRINGLYLAINEAF